MQSATISLCITDRAEQFVIDSGVVIIFLNGNNFHGNAILLNILFWKHIGGGGGGGGGVVGWSEGAG